MITKIGIGNSYAYNSLSAAENISNSAIESNQEDYLIKLQSDYNCLESAIESEQDEYQRLLEEQEKRIKELERANEEKLEEAKEDYNEDEDGSWTEFVNGIIGPISDDIDNLKSSFGAKIDTIKDNIASLSNKMQTKASQILAVKSSISDSTAQEKSSYMSGSNSTKSVNNVSGMNLNSTDTLKTEEDLINLISSEEYAYVEKYNINLTEKMSDGNPRYLFAKGQRDGQYHIFDMSNTLRGAKSDGKTLPRLYGGYGAGRKVIDYGDGMLRIGDFKEKTGKSDGHGSWSSGESEEIFWLDTDGSVKSTSLRYKTYSPLSFDLNGDGVKTSDRKTAYDIDGDGVKDIINDSADAVLVFDRDGNGISGENGLECFGDSTDIDGDGKKDGFKDGFEALKVLAEQEGLISQDDTKLSSDDIKVLEEKFGLKIKTNGYNSEAISLSDVGITEINLAQTDATVLKNNFDNNGNQLMTQEGATFIVNGAEREYADIWHKKY